MTTWNSIIKFPLEYIVSWCFVAEALKTFPPQSNFQQISSESLIAIILVGLLTFMMFWLCNVTGKQKWCKTAVTTALQNLAQYLSITAHAVIEQKQNNPEHYPGLD